MKVVSVRSEDVDYVRSQYDDGVSVVVDLTPYLLGPIFDPIRSDSAYLPKFASIPYSVVFFGQMARISLRKLWLRSGD